MKIAMALFRYFPFGGLQRDFLRVAEIARERGHQVDVLVSDWEGERPQGLAIHEIPVASASNHGAMLGFSRAVLRWRDAHPGYRLAAFNRLPGVDLYFAADSCFAGHVAARPAAVRLLPRYRTFLDLERTLLGPRGGARILFLNDAQKDGYLDHYALAPDRYRVLPPGVRRDRMRGQNAAELRQASRSALGVDDGTRLLLFLGSGFRIKGLDRALAAIASLPDDLRDKACLMVVGADDARPFEARAASLGLSSRIRFLGGREDVPALLQAADLLLHPAYRESAGMVLVEAIVAGLPVLTTDTCGYASLVRDANAGLVMGSPFSQDALDAALARMLREDARNLWGRAALDYASRTNLFGMHETVVDEIEKLGGPE